LTGCDVSVGFENAKCLSCGSGYKLNNSDGTCFADTLACPDGYFLFTDGSSKLECLPCHKSCLTCSGFLDHECLTCAEDTPLYFTYDTGKIVCLSSCPSGTTRTTNKTCICDAECSTCTIDNIDDLVVSCSACVNASLYREGHTCIESHFCEFGTYGYSGACASACGGAVTLKDEESRECVSTCDTSISVLSSDGTECLIECPSGEYSDGSQCQACVTPCLKCTSSTFCLECDTDTDYLFEVAGICGPGTTDPCDEEDG
jgi:proprotein convertase subtilisin/kexin type 5